MVDNEQLVRKAYISFNARDIDGALALMTPDVDWPDVKNGRRLTGHDEVRAYWSAQWQEIDPHVEPRRIERTDDGRLTVEVDQLIRDLNGHILVDGTITHVYTIRDGLVARMEVIA